MEMILHTSSPWPPARNRCRKVVILAAWLVRSPVLQSVQNQSSCVTALRYRNQLLLDDQKVNVPFKDIDSGCKDSGFGGRDVNQ